MRKLLSLIISLSVLVLVTSSLKSVVYAAGSPLQISPFHSNGASPCGIFYSPSAYTFTYSGGTVWLSGLSNGTGNIYTDDKIEIKVTRPDSSVANFSHDYGTGTLIVPTSPQNITNLFQTGNNTVEVKMTDLRIPYCNSSPYWLVETSGSGPAKPTILPRSTWLGDNNGTSAGHTPNRIVVHHLASTNDPGGPGTVVRELQLAIKKNLLTSQTRALPATLLSNLGHGNYSSIRNSWEGQIWLAWMEHRDKSGYGNDIGYHYL